MPSMQANRRMHEQGCLAVMAGRGALTKPWLFEEWRTQQEIFPTAEERVGIYRSFPATTCIYLEDLHAYRHAAGHRRCWQMCSDEAGYNVLLTWKLLGCRQLVGHMREHFGDDDMVNSCHAILCLRVAVALAKLKVSAFGPPLIVTLCTAGT